MRILIIGGCGYIGSALYEQMKDIWHVDTVDIEWFGNNTNKRNIKMDYALLNEEHIATYDVIVLAAAHSSVPMCQQDRYGAYKNNVDNFVSLVDKIEATGKPIKLIYASSSCVYVETKDKPAIETDLLSPVDVLSYTKTAIDQYASISNVEYYGLRFGSVCGWSENFRADLMVNAMTLNALTKGMVTVSNAESYRPILSIRDLVQSVYRIIESKEDKRGVYNIASFNARIGDIANAVAKVTNTGILVGEHSKTYNFSIDNTKFKEQYHGKHQLDTIESIVLNLSLKLRENKDKQFLKREIKDELYGK